MVDDASDDDLPYEMLPEVAGFFAALDETFTKNEKRLGEVKGNLLIHVFELATRMYVTSGPNQGIHHDATDDDVHYTLAVSQLVLLELLDPKATPDLEAYEADGRFHMEGDPEVYKRFMALGKAKNPLSIRFSS